MESSHIQLRRILSIDEINTPKNKVNLQPVVLHIKILYSEKLHYIKAHYIHWAKSGEPPPPPWTGPFPPLLTGSSPGSSSGSFPPLLISSSPVPLSRSFPPLLIGIFSASWLLDEKMKWNFYFLGPNCCLFHTWTTYKHDRATEWLIWINYMVTLIRLLFYRFLIFSLSFFSAVVIVVKIKAWINYTTF